MADTVAGSTLWIAGTEPIDFSTDETALADFEGLSYTEIKGLSNIGEFGASSNILTFPLISDEYVDKSKGTRNAGDPAIVAARMPRDPGQIAVRAAEKTKYKFNFKLVDADAESELHTNTVTYFRALVAGIPNQRGGNEDFVTETYALGIYPRPIIVFSHIPSSAP